MIMNILKNLLGNNSKISSDSIAIKTEEGKGISLSNYLQRQKTFILYDNDKGTTSIAELSDIPTKYEILIIEWEATTYTDVWKKETTVILHPSEADYSKNSSFYNSENARIYSTQTVYNISNNKITITQNQGGSVGASTAYSSNGNVWAIKKVIALNKKNK